MIIVVCRRLRKGWLAYDMLSNRIERANTRTRKSIGSVGVGQTQTNINTCVSFFSAFKFHMALPLSGQVTFFASLTLFLGSLKSRAKIQIRCRKESCIDFPSLHSYMDRVFDPMFSVSVVSLSVICKAHEGKHLHWVSSSSGF